MSTNAVFIRGTSSFTSGAAKFGTGGRANGMFGAPNLMDFFIAAVGTTVPTLTLEAWVNRSTAPSATAVITGRDAARFAWIGINASGLLATSVAGSAVISGGTSICDGQWHHVALVVRQGIVSLFADGNRIYLGTTALTSGGGTSTYAGLGIGGFTSTATSDFGAFPIDEVRLSRTARYTGATYTVPTAAFTPDLFTDGLFHLESDGTDSSTTVAPSIPNVTISTSGTTDTISYTGAGAGTNAISGYSLYAGTTAGGENATPVATNTGSSAGTFTAANTNSARYYFVRAFDTASNYSDNSIEVYNGLAAPSASAPTIGTITIASSAGTDTITYPAPVAGTGTVSGVSLYAGTAAGAESATPVATNTGTSGGTFTAASPSSGSKFYYVKAFDTAGNYSAASNEVTSSANPSATFAPNDAGIVYSPYTWDVTASRALAVNEGAYFRTRLVGVTSSTTVTLNFDITSMVGTNQTRVAYRVDGAAWNEVTLSPGSFTISIPSYSTNWPSHLLEVMVKSMTAGVDKWSSPYATAAKFTGMTVSPAATLAAPGKAKLVGLFLGDSITAGISVLSSAGNETARSDAALGWAWEQRRQVGAEVGIVGFGGQGASYAPTSVPNMQTTYNAIASGLPRSFTTTPDFVWINIGTNDSRQGVSAATFTSALTTILNGLIAATPSSTKVIVQLPFGLQYGVTPYQNAIAASTAPKRVAFVDTTGWWSNTDSPDALHPYGYINLAVLAPLVGGAIRAAINGGAQWIRRPDGSLKQVNPIRR